MCERERKRGRARKREREERERVRETERGGKQIKKIGEEICIGNSLARQQAVVVLNVSTHEKAALIQP